MAADREQRGRGTPLPGPRLAFMLQLHVLRVSEAPSLCIVNLFSNLASVTEELILIQVEVTMAASSVV